ncbi:MAG: TerC family protein [Burkholderiales bacterium]
MHHLASPAFWVALGEIMMVNIVLSGDNAVVIALAARSLPPRQQKQAIIWGSVAATVILVTLTIIAAEVFQLPYLRLVGSLLLFWIAVQLILPGKEGEDGVRSGKTAWAAMRTILVADLIMSTDNIIGVAATAKGDLTLLVLGLGVSIPVVVFGSTIVMKLIGRFPIIITAGAALLGWVAGDMLDSDPILVGWIAAHMPWLQFTLPLVGEISWTQIAGAALVVAVGKLLAARAARAEIKPIDLAAGARQSRSH